MLSQLSGQFVVVTNHCVGVVSRYKRVRASKAKWTVDDHTGGRVLYRAEEFQQSGLQISLL